MTKKKYLIAGIGILFTLLLALLAIFLIDKPQDTTTASAATNSAPVYTIRGRVQRGSAASDVDVSKNFTVEMRTLSTSGETGWLEQNVVLDWTYVCIDVKVITIKEHISFSLWKDGEEYEKKALSDKGTMSLFSGKLPDGKYEMIYSFFLKNGTVGTAYNYVFYFTIDTTPPQYSLTAGGKEIATNTHTNQDITFSASDPNFKGIYCKRPQSSSFYLVWESTYRIYATPENVGWWTLYAMDTVGQQSQWMNVYMDCLPPTLSCSSGASFGGTSGKGFTVTATDGSETEKLYIKFEDEEWFSTGSSYTIPDTERNGRYYFYAEDGVGNRSDTTWIVLSTEDPSGSFVKSDTDNSVSFVWNNQYWSAKLDGANYTEGRIISSEGQHEIVLSNNALKKKNYTFKIDHYYVVVDQTAATCFSDGVKHYECSQCGDTYEEIVYSSGHQYNVISSPSSCTESGRITYACSKCGDRYETEGSYPKGHNYIVTIVKEPTCTEEGIRLSTCEDCGDSFETTIAANGHNYGIAEVQTSKGKTTRIYTCDTCGATYKQELGDQYEAVSNYVEYLFLQYQPYMWWVLLAAAGVWSIAIGVMIAIAQKHEDKEKSKKMLINYVIGLVVIAVILVACPFLMRGIAALIT